MQGFHGVDVGDRIRVQLMAVDVQRGFIDVKTVGSSRQGEDNNGRQDKQDQAETTIQRVAYPCAAAEASGPRERRRRKLGSS